MIKSWDTTQPDLDAILFKCVKFPAFISNKFQLHQRHKLNVEIPVLQWVLSVWAIGTSFFKAKSRSNVCVCFKASLRHSLLFLVLSLCHKNSFDTWAVSTRTPSLFTFYSRTHRVITGATVIVAAVFVKTHMRQLWVPLNRYNKRNKRHWSMK